MKLLLALLLAFSAQAQFASIRDQYESLDGQFRITVPARFAYVKRIPTESQGVVGKWRAEKATWSLIIQYPADFKSLRDPASPRARCEYKAKYCDRKGCAVQTRALKNGIELFYYYKETRYGIPFVSGCFALRPERTYEFTAAMGPATFGFKDLKEVFETLGSINKSKKAPPLEAPKANYEPAENVVPLLDEQR
jgi:hypothetical protein